MRRSIAMIIVFSVIGLSSYAHADGPHNVHTSDGRYQLIQLSQMRADQFLLDTQTGKIWQRQCQIAGPTSSDCLLEAWTLNNVEGITIQKSQLDRIQQVNKPKTPKPKDSYPVGQAPWETPDLSHLSDDELKAIAEPKAAGKTH